MLILQYENPAAYFGCFFAEFDCYAADILL